MRRLYILIVLLMTALLVACNQNEEIVPQSIESSDSSHEESDNTEIASTHSQNESVIASSSSEFESSIIEDSSVEDTTPIEPEQEDQTVEPVDPAVSGSVPDQNYDFMYTEEIRISVVDSASNPVGNLCVNLERTSGMEGSFTPGDALTNFSTGAVLREAHPGEYNVIITDRKQLDYDGITQRNQMIFPVTVVEGIENNFEFVWEKQTPRELDLADPDKVVLSFVDKSGNPIQDLWVTMGPVVENPEPEGRQIIPGITDQAGKVYWTSYEIGRFAGGCLLNTAEGDGPYISGSSFSFEVTGPAEFVFTWEPE